MSHFNMSRYCKSSENLITKTLFDITQIKGGLMSCFEHGCYEIALLGLIAEFAATFSIREWTADQGWNLSQAYYHHDFISKQTKLIIDAQKGGAAFDCVILQDHCIKFTEWEFGGEAWNIATKLSIPADFTRPKYSDTVYELITQLELHTLEFWVYSARTIMYFYQILATGLKIKTINLTMGGTSNKDTEALRCFFCKFKSGAPLPSVSNVSIAFKWRFTVRSGEVIAEYIRGFKFQTLELSFRSIDTVAIILAKAIIVGVELKSLILSGEITCEGHAALLEAEQVTGCEVSFRSRYI